jgi:predicted DNA-binding transcriptional regulator YafY
MNEMLTDTGINPIVGPWKMKAEDIIELARMMQRTREGVSLHDIQEEFGMSRRTAERMRDGVGRAFSQMQEVDTGERTKRWRLPAGIINTLIGFTAEELAELDNAIAMMKRENLIDHARILEGLAAKVRDVASPDAMRRAEPDYEALMEAEGLIMRPGPRPIIREGVMPELREAIKACRRVKIHYRSQGSGISRWQLVEPYGFLYGNRHYLVAYSLNPNGDDYRLYRLSNISEVNAADRMFTRDPEFSLPAFAERSFGVYQEEPFDVAWKFSPAAAPEAREFLFHPTQTMEEQDDGSLIVRFHAGGWVEMDWHLYTWGDEVEVLEPTDWYDE